MDVDEYWQSNRRFVGVVVGGLLVFMVARSAIGRTLGADVKAERRALQSAQAKLRNPMYAAADRTAAEQDNQALRAMVGQLEVALEFVPRESFDLTDVRSASSLYHGTLARVREDLLALAGRANMVLDGDLGQPDLSPTRPEEIGRDLAGLDLVERLVRLAIETNVERVEDLVVVLDPGLRSQAGVGYVEATRVRATLGGSSASLLEFLRRARRSERVLGGQPLVVEALDMWTAKSGAGAELEVTFNVIRLTSQSTLKSGVQD